WRPALELARDWAADRKEIAELLPKVRAGKPVPPDALDLTPDHALRYPAPAKDTRAPAAIRTEATPPLAHPLGLHRPHGGKDVADLEARVGRMATRAVERLNEYRRPLKLQPVALGGSLSRACRAQAIYIDLNRGEGEKSWTFRGAPTPHQAIKGQ